MNEVTHVFKDLGIICIFLTKFRYLLCSDFTFHLIGFSSVKKILENSNISFYENILSWIILPDFNCWIKKENSLSCREELNMMTRNSSDAEFRKVQRFFIVAHPERKHVAGAKSNEMV